VGKPEGKRPLERPRHGQVVNIKMYLREVGCSGMDWIDLTQDRDQWKALVNMVINFQVHKMLGSCLIAAQLEAPQEGLSSTKLV
jgi:hypothetical protein